MRNFFISIAMIVTVLAVGGGLARHAHLTLDPHHACCGDACRTSAATGVDHDHHAHAHPRAADAHDDDDSADGTAPTAAADPSEPRRPTPDEDGPGEPCGICLLLATHLLAPDTSPVLTPTFIGAACPAEPATPHVVNSRDVPAVARPRAPPHC